MKKIITLLMLCLVIGANAQNVCFGNSYTLNATNPQNLTNLSYSANPGAITSTNAAVVVTPTASAVYTVYTTGTTSTSAQATTSFTQWVFVQAVPVVSPSYTQASCTSTANGFNLNITFTPVTSPGYTLTWATVNGTPNIPNNVFSLQQYSATGGINPGPYSTTITTSSGCTTSVSFTMLPIPTPVTVQLNVVPALVCQGGSATITASGASTYTWSTGANGSSLVVSPSVTTNYSVIGSSAQGCTASLGANAVVSAQNLTVTTTKTLMCIGDSAILSASGATSSYTWSTGTKSTSIKVKPTSSTAYTVSGSTANGCLAYAVITQSVMDCTGINEQASGAVLFLVCPNPAKNEATLRWQHANGDGSFYLINLVGQTIYNQQIKEGETILNLGNFPAGIYTYRLLTGSKPLAHGTLMIE